MSGERGPLRTIAVEIGDPALFPEPVLQLYDGGKRQAARALLVQVVQLERDPVRRGLQTRYLRDGALWADPTTDAAGRFVVDNPVVRIYAGRTGPDGLRVGVRWLSALWVPLLPLGAFLVSGTARGWRVHGRSPLPLWSWLVPAAWVALGLVIVLPVAYQAFEQAFGRAELVAYNGFDAPVEVTVGDRREVLAPGGHARFPGLRLEEVAVSAAVDGRVFDTATADLGNGDDVIVYNVAARGLLRIRTVRYSTGTTLESPEELLVDPVRITVLQEPFDYVFEPPPDTMSVSVADGFADRTSLEAVTFPAGVDPYAVLLTAGEEAHALAVADAELALHPDDPAVFRRAAEHRSRFVPDAGSDWIRTERDRRPGDFEAHRTYQDFAPISAEALVAEYDALAAAAPDSLRARSLAARARRTTPEAGPLFEAVLAADPGDVPTLRELAEWRLRGADWAGADAAYGRLEALGERAPWARRMRLARALGRPMPLDEDPNPVLRAEDLLAVSTNPWSVDEVLARVLARDPTMPRREVDGIDAALRLRAGQLDTAQRLLGSAADPFPAALLLALSDGATRIDRMWALSMLPEPAALAPGDRILAWALVVLAGPARRAEFEAALLDGPVGRVVVGIADDPARLADRAWVDAHLAYRVEPEERAALYAALAVLAGTGESGAAWRAEARRIALPWDLPWFRG